MDDLIFDPDSLTNFVPTVDANFQFTTPVKVQAMSTSGQVITDGPDSMLVSGLTLCMYYSFRI